MHFGLALEPEEEAVRLPEGGAMRSRAGRLTVPEVFNEGHLFDAPSEEVRLLHHVHERRPNCPAV